ncbi:hypothetical protein IFR05_009652 [Cadophora sp. M221]|nr:hypothetical protein IFR05_009652 [Cadophora sp. M221]
MSAPPLATFHMFSCHLGVMNPNAPDHQPDKARDIVIVRLAREKMFSPPDDETAKKLNKRVRAFDDLTNLRIRIRIQNKQKFQAQSLPQFPLFTWTPTADESNVCTGVRINSRQGLRVLDPDAGTPAVCTESYLQFICDYANRWHSKLTGINYHSAGSDPRFFFFPSHQNFHNQLMSNTTEEMAQETSEHLTRAQFWKLRYLFILINFVPNLQTDAHVALCAISPEAKTVDYVCSGGDTGLPNSPRSGGSRCLPYIFAWLASFLGNSFFPYDWRLRTNAGHVQERSRGDCAIYTATHAQCLAFGYGITDAFPSDHQTKILNRRRRYVQDLMYQGFEDFKDGERNTQYYPLLDSKPTALRSEGFYSLPGAVLEVLPAEVANKRLIREIRDATYALHKRYGLEGLSEWHSLSGNCLWNIEYKRVATSEDSPATADKSGRVLIITSHLVIEHGGVLAGSDASHA